jgi:hypothetical protein
MIKWGWLTRPPVEAILEPFFKIPDLKQFLRERDLPASGKKADLLARLLSADWEGITSKVSNVTAYVCTLEGKALADDFCAKELEAQRQVDARCLEKVAQGDFRGAAREVAEYSRQRVIFDSPIAISLDDHDQELLLRYTAAARPRILQDVSPEDWKVAQNAAVMRSLWGAKSAKQWLPESFKGASNLAPDVAVRMVAFAGKTKWDVHRMRQCGVKTVKVLGCGSDSCLDCRELNDSEYPIKRVPEVPHPTCTHPKGCRCVVIAEKIFLP